MCVKDEGDLSGKRMEKVAVAGTGGCELGGSASQLESICENTAIVDSKQKVVVSFVPTIRSGVWSDIGSRSYMEDTHVCITDLAKNFGCRASDDRVISFYGVFDGHGGKAAAQFVRDNLPRIIVEDVDFPLELEKAIIRSFETTDHQFAQKCTIQPSLSSGTTAITAIIFGRTLLVANVGDCRAVLSRFGMAMEMSKDHRPCHMKERNRIESLGGYIDDGYLNGQLGVTRALGDWHLEGMKEAGIPGGPLSAEPELKITTLTKEDEFLIIGSDGIWDMFTNQNAVDFTRRRLQEHNDVDRCCVELVEEAIKREADDNLTVIVVCFQSDPPAHIPVVKPKVRRSISDDALHNLKRLLEN